MSSKANDLNVNLKIIYAFVHVETLVIACTVSQILAQLDYKGPNWNFLTLNLTFYDSIGFTPNHLHNAKYVGSTLLLLNNNDNYGKTISDLASDISNNSTNLVSL